MEIQSTYEDSPGSAVSQAVRMYRIGKGCQTALDLGVNERQLCVMTGLSIAALQECMKVADLYQSDDEFIKAFQDHTMPAGAPYRTWGTFLIANGINVVSQREAAQTMAYIKSAVQRLVMVAQGSADPSVAHAALGQLRSWLDGRIPPTIWATIDRNFFLYQRCSFCSGEPNDPELVEHNGLLLTRCIQCKSEGIQPSGANWETVAAAYAAYAYECNHAAEVYRTV